MDPRTGESWGERLAADGTAGGQSSGRLIRDAIGVVRGRLGEIARGGIQPLLQEAAAQIKPATLAELRARYPGLTDDEVARRLIDRAARTAAGVALSVGGILAAQEAIAVASATVPPAGGAALGTVGVTALAEVLVLFAVEAKLRADLGALAGQRALAPRELVAEVVGEVQAAGGLAATLRRRSLRLAMPSAVVRRTAARIAAMIPARFARVVIPEVIAPIVGSAFAARLASRQLRAVGEQRWGELRLLPRTTVTWRPATDNGQAPRGGTGHRAQPPPDDTSHPQG
jgi:hypothetical protein